MVAASPSNKTTNQVPARGRVKRHAPVSSGAWLLFLSLLAAGCAGQTARNKALAPSVVMSWPQIQEDALRGIQDKLDDGEVGALGAESRRETVSKFGEAVKLLEGPK